MGGMADGSAPDDLWHLTIDDLLSSPPEPKPIGGAGPYVINLSASTAPISVPLSGLLGFDQLHVYQVQQRENGQQRFRLRLGPIDSELEADAILGVVREHYPRALTAAADEDDLRAIAHAAARNERKPARSASASAPDRPPAVAAPSVAPTAPRSPELPAKAPPATAEDGRSRPASRPPSSAAPPVRVDDPVSARELAAIFLEASDPVPTVVSKKPSVAAPTVQLQVSSPVVAAIAEDKAKPATPSPAVNVQASMPARPPAVAENARLVPPPSHATEKLKVAPSSPLANENLQAPPKSPAAAPVGTASISPPSPAPAPVVEAKATPPAPTAAPVETAKAAPVAPSPAPIELPKSAAAASPPPSIEPAKGVQRSTLAAPVASAKGALTVPVLGVEHVAAPRVARRRPLPVEAATAPRREPATAPPTLRADAPVEFIGDDEFSFEPMDAWSLVPSSAADGAPMSPSPAALASSVAAAAPASARKAPAASAPVARVALADFFAREAPAFRAADWASVSRPAVESPVATVATKAAAQPPVDAAPAMTLSLEPSLPRVPLVDPTLHLSPAPAARELRHELNATAPSRPRTPATPPAVGRPPDLLAEIAASRPRPAKSPTTSPAGLGTSPAGVAAPEEVKLAPAKVPNPSPLSTADAAAATPARLEAPGSATPVTASAPAAPPASTVATQPPSAPRQTPIVVLSPPPPAPQAPAHVPPPVAAKAPARVPASAVVAAKAPTIAPSTPTRASVDATGIRRSLAHAPSLPAGPSAFHPAATEKPSWPIDPPAKPHAPLTAAKAPAPAAKPVPALERTQTVRALTSLELGAGDASRLFAIQLAVGESEFRPDDIPNLGIFDEYRLYSTIGLDGDKVMHALRLGFFTDEGAAEAVAGYLRSHFENAALKRVSTAERDRFAEQRVKAKKDAGATGIHAAIELRSPDLKTTTSLADLSQRTSRRRSDEPRR